MTSPIISAHGLGKEYHLGAALRHDTLRDQLASGFRRLFKPKTDHRKAKMEDASFWALRDVSFDIAQGEVVGVIGRNGAGKSTLLKILSQITEPTEGEVRIRGRIASLLEVGTGFHPELSGRENVFLNGAILGMSRAEIRKKFDEIVAFAEVEKFLDTPVKRYSSGMYVRLAFAVAAHLEPEILVIDEVLAVGDAAFQKKCLGKMKEVGTSGRTVIFVSHNMGTVANLCSRGIVMQSGRIGFQGTAEEAIQHYNRIVVDDDAGSRERAANVLYMAPPNQKDDFSITRVEMLDFNGQPKPVLATWDNVVLRFHYRCAKAVQRGSLAFQLSSFDATKLVTLSTQPDGTLPLPLEAGDGAVDLVIEKFPMAAGDYVLGAGLAIPLVEYLCWNPELCWFSVFPRDVYGSGLAPNMPRSVTTFQHSWRTAKP